MPNKLRLVPFLAEYILRLVQYRKSTIAEEFATNEYDTHILVDFAACSSEIRDLFNDVSDLNRTVTN